MEENKTRIDQISDVSTEKDFCLKFMITVRYDYLGIKVNTENNHNLMSLLLLVKLVLRLC